MGTPGNNRTSELRAFRKRRKRTLADQAEAFGMTGQYLGRVERGEVPGEDKVRAIFEVTHGRITPNMIFGLGPQTYVPLRKRKAPP